VLEERCEFSKTAKFSHITLQICSVLREKPSDVQCEIYCGKNNMAGDRGSTVVKVLCYKSEVRWFDPRWCHWKFSLT
jgi:hypothetical protein